MISNANFTGILFLIQCVDMSFSQLIQILCHKYKDFYEETELWSDIPTMWQKTHNIWWYYKMQYLIPPDQMLWIFLVVGHH